METNVLGGNPSICLGKSRAGLPATNEMVLRMGLIAVSCDQGDALIGGKGTTDQAFPSWGGAAALKGPVSPTKAWFND